MGKSFNDRRMDPESKKDGKDLENYFHKKLKKFTIF